MRSLDKTEIGSHLFDEKVIKEKISAIDFKEELFEKTKRSLLSLRDNQRAVVGFKREENVKMKLVVPLLESLGYDAQTDLKFEDSAYRGAMEIAIRVSEKSSAPDCLVEVKSWKKDIDKLELEVGNSKYKSDVQQGLSYAVGKEIDWFIITNGFEWRLYKTFIAGQLPYNFYESFNLEGLEDISNFKKFYLLFSRESFSTNFLSLLYSETEANKERLSENIFEILTDCRSKLFKNLFENNKRRFSNNGNKLMEAGQKLIDRFVFIRFCEDNKLLGRRVLYDYLKHWEAGDPRRKRGDPVSLEIQDIFHYIMEGDMAEDISSYYGSFFREDLPLSGLRIDNLVLKEVISSLYYYDDGAYIDFSEIPLDILGHIYERYLSLSLILKEKGLDYILKEESTRERRRVTGSYYTPKYIVGFIIEQTIFRLLNRDLTALPELRILDPACGSGVFLSNVYDVLYGIYAEFYETREHEESLNGNTTGTLRKYKNMRSVINKKILSDNLYGVDLNPESVEITKLSLWFKTAQKGVPLNSLEENIRLGDSLIDNSSLSEYAFNWSKEFEDVVNEEKGGFDVIVGNPPYFKIRKDNPLAQTSNYKEISVTSTNAAALFLNLSFTLLKEGGLLGFVVPKQLVFTKGWRKIRAKIFAGFEILSIVDCRQAFKDVLLEQVIIILRKQRDNLDNVIELGLISEGEIQISGEIDQRLCAKDARIYLEYNTIIEGIKKKCEVNSVLLDSVSDINMGLGIQKLKSEGVFRRSRLDGDLVAIGGDEVQRYFLRNLYYFNPEEEKLKKYVKRISVPAKRKIVIQRIIAYSGTHIKLTASGDDLSSLSFNTVLEVYPKVQGDHYYLLGLLNSRLISFYAHKFIYINAVRSMDLTPIYAQQIPILRARTEDKEEISSIVKDIEDSYKEKNDYGVHIRSIFQKFSGYKKTKMNEIVSDTSVFWKLEVKKNKKIRVRDIRVHEADSDFLYIHLNQKPFLKIQIKDKEERLYLKYYLDSLDTLFLKSDGLPTFNVFKELEIDDLSDKRGIQAILSSLKGVKTKYEMELQIKELEAKLNEKIYSMYNLNKEEQEYIENTFK